MIDLTPLDVRKKKGDFRRALRGYDPLLVDDFLDLAADRIEHLAREHATLTERLSELERRVGEYRDRERALTDALVTAQEMREEIRAQSAREAALALRTSTQEAEARLRDAEQRS
jgi:cell division initiation protein